MKIVHLTDIHGNSEQLSRVSKWLDVADLVILSGDITHFGRKKDTEKIILKIEKYTKNIVCVTGNCDYPDVQAFLEDRKYFLGDQVKTINHFYFIGLSGSLPCPGCTPNEYSEDQYEEMINSLKSKINAQYPVMLISHQPPHDTKNDKVIPGMHVGSKAIRKFIKEVQPLACFTGHIHEGQAVDLLGKTKIINPGPFKKGNFAWITTENNELHVDLKKT